jgi:indole-3-glycerol phosphate synthase
MDYAAARILPRIPKSCIAVAESGYRTAAEIRKAATAGADAVLIGSELSAALRPAQLLAELVAVKRSRNARKN